MQNTLTWERVISSRTTRAYEYTKLKAANFAVLIFCQYKKDIVQMKNPAVLNYFVKWREPKEPLNSCSGKVNIRILYA